MSFEVLAPSFVLFSISGFGLGISGAHLNIYYHWLLAKEKSVTN